MSLCRLRSETEELLGVNEPRPARLARILHIRKSPAVRHKHSRTIKSLPTSIERRMLGSSYDGFTMKRRRPKAKGTKKHKKHKKKNKRKRKKTKRRETKKR